MYPAGELRRLAARKALLEARISMRRLQCMVHGAELARPIGWIDRAWTHWKKISPFVKMIGVPLALGVGRKVARRHGKISGLIRYLPIVLQGWRMIRAHTHSHHTAEAAR